MRQVANGVPNWVVDSVDGKGTMLFFDVSAEVRAEWIVVEVPSDQPQQVSRVAGELARRSAIPVMQELRRFPLSKALKNLGLPPGLRVWVIEGQEPVQETGARFFELPPEPEPEPEDPSPDVTDPAPSLDPVEIGERTAVNADAE